MIVVAVVIVTMVVMRSSRVGISAMAMPVIMMFDRVATRVARMRPEYGDQAGQNGAQQRQENDCLNHGWG